MMRPTGNENYVHLESIRSVVIFKLPHYQIVFQSGERLLFPDAVIVLTHGGI